MGPRSATRGFTLVELLIALGLLALMATLSWRAIDSMVRTQTQLQAYSDEVLSLQAGLAQWGIDLDAVATGVGAPGLDWDGRVLRMVRRHPTDPGGGVLVVAWTLRDLQGTGQWMRWQSPAVTTRGELQTMWQRAKFWGQSAPAPERAHESRLAALQSWQIFYYRSDSWSNPLSSDSTQAASADPAGAAMPDGVRLILTLADAGALHGRITRDWIRPSVGGGK